MYAYLSVICSTSTLFITLHLIPVSQCPIAFLIRFKPCSRFCICKRDDFLTANVCSATIINSAILCSCTALTVQEKFSCSLAIERFLLIAKIHIWQVIVPACDKFCCIYVITFTINSYFFHIFLSFLMYHPPRSGTGFICLLFCIICCPCIRRVRVVVIHICITPRNTKSFSVILFAHTFS